MGMRILGGNMRWAIPSNQQIDWCNMECVLNTSYEENFGVFRKLNVNYLLINWNSFNKYCISIRNHRHKILVNNISLKIVRIINVVLLFVFSLVVTAVSPNVVVTILLRLKEQKLGLNKGIHTLIIAMTSCNDVIAIFLFGVVLSAIFSTGNKKRFLFTGFGLEMIFVWCVSLL